MNETFTTGRDEAGLGRNTYCVVPLIFPPSVSTRQTFFPVLRNIRTWWADYHDINWTLHAPHRICPFCFAHHIINFLYTVTNGQVAIKLWISMSSVPLLPQCCCSLWIPEEYSALLSNPLNSRCSLWPQSPDAAPPSSCTPFIIYSSSSSSSPSTHLSVSVWHFIMQRL